MLIALKVSKLFNFLARVGEAARAPPFLTELIKIIFPSSVTERFLLDFWAAFCRESQILRRLHSFAQSRSDHARVEFSCPLILEFVLWIGPAAQVTCRAVAAFPALDFMIYQFWTLEIFFPKIFLEFWQPKTAFSALEMSQGMGMSTGEKKSWWRHVTSVIYSAFPFDSVHCFVFYRIKWFIGL